MLSHVMCDLGKTENDTDKPSNIIEGYETAYNFFTTDYIFIRGKLEKIKYQSYCQKQEMPFKIRGGNQGKN